MFKPPSKYDIMIDAAIAALEDGEEPTFSSLCVRNHLSKDGASIHFGNVEMFWDAVDKQLQKSGRKLIRNKFEIVSALDESLFTKVKKIIGTGGPYDDRIEEARLLLFGTCKACRNAAVSDSKLCLSHRFYQK